METVLRYRGREVTDKDVVFIRQLIARNSGNSRWVLSRKLCREWGWVQANGALRDMICRGMMLELARAGHPMFAEVSLLEHVETIDLPTGHWPMFTRPDELARLVLASLPD